MCARGIWTSDAAICPFCSSSFCSFSSLPSALFSSLQYGCTVGGSNRRLTALSLSHSVLYSWHGKTARGLLHPRSIFSTSFVYSHWSPIAMVTQMMDYGSWSGLVLLMCRYRAGQHWFTLQPVVPEEGHLTYTMTNHNAHFAWSVIKISIKISS